MPSDSSAQEQAKFDVLCPKCGAKVQTHAGDRRTSIACPACGGGIDLATDEVKHARQAAAAKASIDTHQPSGGPGSK